MNMALFWGMVCGAIAGAILSGATGSTPIGIGIVVVVGAATAYVVQRWQRPRADR